MAKKLIAFYSRADENYVSGMLKMLDVGNTELAADILREITGADIFRIEQEKPYSKSYNECIAEAQADLRSEARPKLKALPGSISEYDTIYLGYPNYWGTMPMAVATFLESFDFSGVTIKPFCTHEGSGMGNSEKDIKRLCPGATLEKGLAIHGSKVGGSSAAIKKWA